MPSSAPTASTANGDVANKIGTYLKALAAHDNGVPFYVAAAALDHRLDARRRRADIPIEERAGDEVAERLGADGGRHAATGQGDPSRDQAHNPGFDVTPARLVTAIITERGVARPADLAAMFPDRAG